MRGAYHSDNVREWGGCDCDLMKVGGVSGERERAGDGSGHVTEGEARRAEHQLQGETTLTLAQSENKYFCIYLNIHTLLWPSLFLLRLII